MREREKKEVERGKKINLNVGGRLTFKRFSKIKLLSALNVFEYVF